MSALTGPRRVTQKGDLAAPNYVDAPQKGSVVIYPGALVALNAGYLDNAAANTALTVLGVYDGPTTSDSTSLSDGAIRARVRLGVHAMVTSDITQANVGQLCYVVDNQTVSSSSNTGTRPVAGTILEIDPNFSTLVYVLVGVQLQGPTPAAPVIQTGTLTLSAGTLTKSTGITITANSKVFVSLNTPGGGTQGVKYKVPDASLVVGAPGTGAFAVTAVDNAGALVNTDVSTINYLIVG